jgi:hypothetical protein
MEFVFDVTLLAVARVKAKAFKYRSRDSNRKAQFDSPGVLTLCGICSDFVP